ncbi:MAG: hypothetical protein V8R08_04865 [Coriobacteriales bacterium]
MLSMNAVAILMLLLAVACVIQCAAIVHIVVKSDRRFKDLERRLAQRGVESVPDL